MNHNPDKLVRLAELPPDQDLVGVSALVRAAAAPLPEIVPAKRQRIRGRLYSSLTKGPRAFRHRWQFAFAFVVTLAVGGVVGAATHSAILRHWPRKEAAEPAPAREATSKPRIATRANRPALPEPSLAPEQPSPAPLVPPSVSPAETPPANPPMAKIARRQPTLVPHSDPMPSPLPPPTFLPRSSSLGPAPFHQAVVPPSAGDSRARLETAALAKAIRKLRVEGDAASALSLLDESRTHFADGALSPEASAVRVEALLKLGRTDSALSDLDRLSLDTMPRRDEWRVVRGELRAQAGQWAGAESDFGVVLASRGRDAGAELVERALWGRAAVRSHRGDLNGARADSAEYLRRFPSGRFAGQARQALLTPISP